MTQKALFGKENIRVEHEHGKTSWVFAPKSPLQFALIKKWNINICLEHSAMKNSTTCSEIPPFAENFHFVPKPPT